MSLRDLTLLAALLVPACTSFPEVNAAGARYSTTGEAPALLPMDQVLAAAASGADTSSNDGALSRRAEGLRARAARLRSAE